MKKELNFEQIQQLIGKCYGDYVFTWVVTKNANVTVQEGKALVAKTAEAVRVCDETFDKVEAALAGSKQDEAVYILQTIVEYRKSIQEFKNLYGKESEPNA